MEHLIMDSTLCVPIPALLVHSKNGGQEEQALNEVEVDSSPRSM